MEDAQQRITNLFTAHPIFGKMGPDSLQAIAHLSNMVSVPEGQMIVQEGEASSVLYLLVSGTAVAVREGPDQETIVLNAVAAGDCIGELAFLDGGPRTASVRAETECQVVAIPTEPLKNSPQGQGVVGDLKSALASVVVKRARAMSDEMLASLRRQLEIKTVQNQFGYFLIFTISIFLISTTLFYLVAEDYVADVYDPAFSWQTLIFLALPSLVVIKMMKIPLADLGIKREGAWRSFVESVSFCVAITIPTVIWMVWFQKPSASDDTGATIDGFFFFHYFIHSFFQEVGARGLFQGLFQKFLDDSRGHRSIFLTSIVFASLHITFGIDAVVITFFASIGFGYLYLRQKNLLGVTIVHYWLGVLAAMMVAF